MPYFNLQGFVTIKQTVEMCCLGMWVGVSVLRCRLNGKQIFISCYSHEFDHWSFCSLKTLLIDLVMCISWAKRRGKSRHYYLTCFIKKKCLPAALEDKMYFKGETKVKCSISNHCCGPDVNQVKRKRAVSVEILDWFIGFLFYRSGQKADICGSTKKNTFEDATYWSQR